MNRQPSRRSAHCAVTAGATTDGSVTVPPPSRAPTMRSWLDDESLTFRIRDICRALDARARYASCSEPSRSQPGPAALIAALAQWLTSLRHGPVRRSRRTAPRMIRPFTISWENGRDMQEVEEVVHRRHDGRADEGAADAALAAEQAGAADDDDGDGIELEALALARLAGRQSGDDDQGGDRGTEPADDVDGEDRAVRRDAGQARRLEVVAHRVDVPSEGRVAQDEPGRPPRSAPRGCSGTGTPRTSRWRSRRCPRPPVPMGTGLPS